MARLSENILEVIGFKEAIDTTLFEEGEKCFRLAIDDHDFRFLQITLNPEYGDDNPNCGIAALYFPEHEASAIPPDLYEKDDWTEEDMKRADDYTIICKQEKTNIAWYMTTLERLEALIFGMSGKKITDFTGSYSG